MKNGYRVLDSDLHLMEPPDMYERLSWTPAYRDRIPRATHNRPGHYAGWVLDGRSVPPWIGDAQVLRANEEMDQRAGNVMQDGWERHFDPASSIRAMDAEGIDVAVLFRTAASMLVSLDSLEPDYSLALCRAFNDWVADYCREDLARLKATTIVPQHDAGSGC